MTDKDREAFDAAWTDALTHDEGWSCAAYRIWKAARAESAKELAEKDAEIERLKRVIGSFRYALLKYREEEWLGGEDGIAAEALESETIAFTKKEG